VLSSRRAQVLSVDSDDAVTVRIAPHGATFTTDIKRLRKAEDDDDGRIVLNMAALERTIARTVAGGGSSPRLADMPASVREHASTVRRAALRTMDATLIALKIKRPDTIDVAALQRTLADKFPHLAPMARLNPHAAVGTPQRTRFAAAARARAEDMVIDVMVHGTPDANIDSILQTSLRGRACGTCWFTDNLPTASYYTCGARRIIAFAVLRDKSDRNHICTTKDPAHHLPLFEMDIDDGNWWCW
jgi:hypothetical protein